MSALLTINTGSSSLKFGLYLDASEPELVLHGQVDGIGLAPTLLLEVAGTKSKTPVAAETPEAALAAVISHLQPYLEGQVISGVGHRIVHGGESFAEPTTLTPEVLSALEDLSPLAPLHQPHNLAGVEAARAAFPEAAQVGCFDTAFHRGHPWVNDTFGLPRAYYDAGVRRYGFHGLSYEYITGVLAQDYPKLHAGRVIVAHLGNGASMCAVQGGQSIGSSMGFSALDGLPMGTRCGQIDPGVMLYLFDQLGMSAAEVTRMLYKYSGLLGLSGISSDMRTLLDSDAKEAAQAIDYYVFRARREIGALSAVLGGLDALVFCGGIGENAALIRSKIIEGLNYLGLSLDSDANSTNQVSIGSGRAQVLVIPTDEERVIASAVHGALATRQARV
ncbi:MAG: acetate/propionate family kinase [Pseudomonadota bacterium]